MMAGRANALSQIVKRIKRANRALHTPLPNGLSPRPRTQHRFASRNDHCQVVAQPIERVALGRLGLPSPPIFLRFALHRGRVRVLALDPMSRPTGAIRGIPALRHDPLQAELAGMMEDEGAIFLVQVLVKPQARRCSRAPLPRRFCNLDRLIHAMKARGLDGIVATAPWNVFYLTGFNGIAHKSDEPRPYAVIVRSSFERRGLER
jgi:Creatinase/Prolidase N-terminal domain